MPPQKNTCGKVFINVQGQKMLDWFSQFKITTRVLQNVPPLTALQLFFVFMFNIYNTSVLHKSNLNCLLSLPSYFAQTAFKMTNILNSKIHETIIIHYFYVPSSIMKTRMKFKAI